MIRGLSLAVLAMLAVGCGGESPPAPISDSPAEQAAAPEETAPATPEPRGGSITARLFRRDAVDGGSVKPSLEVTSPNATETEPGVMRFEDTTVTIIGEDDQRTVMTAKVGTLDQNEESAELSGEVNVTMGTMTIVTEHLLWDNEKREATAAKGVSIVDGETKMEARTMRFSPDENTLTLQDVTGRVQLPEAGPVKESRAGVWRTLALWVVMATPAYAQAASSEYTHVVIAKPAPEVVFRDNRLEHMTGGVEIQLSNANANEPPLSIGADTIEFGWSEDGDTELASLTMRGNVSVANAEGDMRSADASFDVAKMQIAFTGGVRGQFEGIDEFEADRLDYNIESGDMEMRNLTATIPFGDTEGGDADGFSSMKVDRAATVLIAENRVQNMRGDVGVSLNPTGGGKTITLNADTFEFGYGTVDQRQPDTVSMSGNVRVDAPQGLIRSNTADFNVAQNRLNFRGSVRGSNEMMRNFSASSFVYDLDNENGDLSSFRANGIRFGKDGGYDSMDVRNAPNVAMRGGRVTKMSGGVEIFLEGGDDQGPVTANADTIDFAYADATSSAPSSVDMNGKVHVNMDDIDVRSDTANFDMASEKVVFSGSLLADLPRAKGVTGAAIHYDLKTGNVSLPSGRVPEIEKRQSEEAPGQP